MKIMKLIRLKEIREENSNTQQEIADILNIKRGTYASWECGSDTIPTKKLFNFANYYEKSIDYILNLSNKNINIIYKNNIDKSIVGKNLKIIRQNLNLSQFKIAESIGINQSTWWAYEKGNTLITTSSLIALSEKYNCSVDWILGRIK